MSRFKTDHDSEDFPASQKLNTKENSGKDVMTSDVNVCFVSFGVFTIGIGMIQLGY